MCLHLLILVGTFYSKHAIALFLRLTEEIGNIDKPDRTREHWTEPDHTNQTRQNEKKTFSKEVGRRKWLRALSLGRLRQVIKGVYLN